MKLFEIGSKIRELRKAKGITQEELAQVADISRVTLGKLERGQVGAVSVKSLDVILDFLGYEIEFKRKDEFGFGIPVFGEGLQ
ncbi:MAG: helix-turn-helix transcriptional regulator [Epsilonproteobacteria bacterium]|nr:helix-turn-helix transcriptional regulator [Campylobacterota bacterium]